MDDYGGNAAEGTIDQDLLQLSNEALAKAMDDFDERQLSTELAQQCVVLSPGKPMSQEELTARGLREPKQETMTPDACMHGQNPIQNAFFNMDTQQTQTPFGVNPVFPPQQQFYGEIQGDADVRPYGSLPSNDLEMDRASSMTSVSNSIIAPTRFQPKFDNQGHPLQGHMQPGHMQQGHMVQGHMVQGHMTSDIAGVGYVHEQKLRRYDDGPVSNEHIETQHQMWQSDMHAQGPPGNTEDVSMVTDDVGITHTVEPDENGECPLHLMSEVTDIRTMAKLIDLLTKCGVLDQCINMQNKYKQTPLFLAVQALNVPLVGYLLASGADPNIQGTVYVDRDTYVWRAPIHLVAMMGNPAVKILNLLVTKSQKTNVNILAHGDKLTALHLALKHHHSPTLNCTQTIKTLIAAGADVSIKEQCSSKTAVILAIETRDLILVKTFLESFPADKRRALLLEQTRAGDTCLHFAAGLSRVSQQQKITLLRLLVMNGANGSIVNHAKEHPRDFARTEWDSIKTR